MRSGADTFLSLDQGCEGRTEQGLSGYVYATPPSDEETSPLYRCRVGAERFASADPGCEGQVVEGLLGYTRRTQELLNRAFSPSPNWPKESTVRKSVICGNTRTHHA